MSIENKLLIDEQCGSIENKLGGVPELAILRNIISCSQYKRKSDVHRNKNMEKRLHDDSTAASYWTVEMRVVKRIESREKCL